MTKRSRNIILDIGANDGTFGVNHLKNWPNDQVYCFEPNPKMIELIKQRTVGLDVIICPMAVSDYCGETTFNIDSLGDSGCSSLLEFQEGLETTWQRRDDLKVTSQITCQVTTLEAFMDKHGLTRIDYIHIDAQGSDLCVLRGCGKYLPNIRAGDMETARDTTVSLYKDQHILVDCLDFLFQNGFVVTKVEPNDFHGNTIPNSGCTLRDCNEANIFFTR